MGELDAIMSEFSKRFWNQMLLFVLESNDVVPNIAKTEILHNILADSILLQLSLDQMNRRFLEAKIVSRSLLTIKMVLFHVVRMEFLLLLDSNYNCNWDSSSRNL